MFFLRTDIIIKYSSSLQMNVLLYFINELPSRGPFPRKMSKLGTFVFLVYADFNPRDVRAPMLEKFKLLTHCYTSK